MSALGLPGGSGGASDAVSSPQCGTGADETLPSGTRDRMAEELYAGVHRTGRADWIELLRCAPLASQHHLSDYSVVKYGAQGAPYIYMPMSLQQPELLMSIQAQQQRYETATWRVHIRAPHLEINEDAAATSTEQRPTVSMEPYATAPALSSGVPLSPLPPSAVRTSVSHPIQYVELLTLV